MYNRTSTYVPPKSTINEVKDLKGKTIGIPIGAAALRITLEACANAGLDLLIVSLFLAFLYYLYPFSR